jgi:hypothetical protein
MKNLIIVIATALLLLTGAVIAQAQMPGDTVGTTQYVAQSNSACGNRIVVDNAGVIHVTWMRLINQFRSVYYNCKTEQGWIAPGLQVGGNGSGYPAIDILSDNRAAIFYHRAPNNNESLYVAIDAANCQGFFDYAYPPNRLTSTHRYIWSNGAVDFSNRMHVVATWNNPTLGGLQDFMYTRSNNGGTTWTAIHVVDTLTTMSPIVVTSPISGKVAIVYSHPADTTSQMKNDIYYIMSNDGITWNWNNMINITGYGQGDSLFAFADLDAVFDYNDRLHIVWVSSRINGGIPIGSVYLYHFMDDPGTIVELTRYGVDTNCDPGPWNYLINKMSLAASPGGAVYTVYTQFDGIDCSSTLEANGELFAQASFDGGHLWGPPTNITHTPSPGCVQPNCLSEIYPSMAEKVDTALHIFYFGYQGAGASHHLMKYYSYSPLLLGAREPTPIPTGFTLNQNYPNPFNAQTKFTFTLASQADVDFLVYDITGKLITRLIDGRFPGGEHQVEWNASRLASGIYFGRLQVNGASQSRKMVLLK